MAIVTALEDAGLTVFHVHRMDAGHLERMRAARRALGWTVGRVPAHDRLGLRLRRALVDRGERPAVVTLVRDPVARNLSSFFEHLDAIYGRARAEETVSPERMARDFLGRYTHREPLTWFDDEMRPVLGIDVYAHRFCASGHQTIHAPSCDLLILKSELPNPAKGDALAAFLGVDGIAVRDENRTDQKRKGEAYRRFVAAVQLDAPYLDMMFESRYARHFYTAEERASFRQRYVAREPEGRGHSRGPRAPNGAVS
jgi:hypothetical protein